MVIYMVYGYHIYGIYMDTIYTIYIPYIWVYGIPIFKKIIMHLHICKC